MDIKKELSELRDEIDRTTTKWKKEIADLYEKAESEPEPKSYFIWGVCDDDCHSHIMTTDQGYKDSDGDWCDLSNLLPTNLFPADKPKKYRLVPADQPHIPWRYSVEEETREDEFQARVILSNGRFARRIWFMKGGEWGFHGADKDKILCYCPVDEFPEAE